VRSSSKNRPDILKLFLGTGFFSGLSPVAPGTAGSLAAIPFIYLLSLWGGVWALLGFLLVWIFISLVTAPAFEAYYGKDPAPFVADEWAGQTIPFLSVGFAGSLAEDIWILVLGFILFRIFDILKPLGIKTMERLPSGTGILADDLLAGLYALLLLKIIILLA